MANFFEGAVRDYDRQRRIDAAKQRAQFMADRRQADLEAQQEAARRQEAEQRRSNVETSRRAKKRADEIGRGTPTREVLSTEAADLCEEFLDFAADHDFWGSTRLNHRNLRTDRRSTIGYGIGSIIFNRESRRASDLVPFGYKPDNSDGIAAVTRFAIGTNLPHNVFLCADGDLWLYTNKPVKPGRTDQRHLFSRNPPHILSSLPLDEEGEPMTPEIGSVNVDYIVKRALGGGNPNRVVHLEHATFQRNDIAAELTARGGNSLGCVILPNLETPAAMHCSDYNRIGSFTS